MSTGAWSIGGGRRIALDRPWLLAILNVTPDSFSDGGRYSAQNAGEFALRAVAAGADGIDVGGESTRPGAAPVPEEEQIRRTVPAIRAIRAAGVGATVTIDTTRASVAQAALDAGADAINDVSAGLDDPGMLALAARRGCGIVLMHRLTRPAADSYSDRYVSPPVYNDVTGAVAEFLAGRIDAAARAGVTPESIVVDPGLGFGKTVDQNLTLIRETSRLLALRRPVVSGISRKSFVGRAGLGRESTPEERVEASVALSVCHLCAGARIFRVHDVAAHAQGLRAAWAVLGTGVTPGGCALAPPGRPA